MHNTENTFDCHCKHDDVKEEHHEEQSPCSHYHHSFIGNIASRNQGNWLKKFDYFSTCKYTETLVHMQRGFFYINKSSFYMHANLFLTLQFHRSRGQDHKTLCLWSPPLTQWLQGCLKCASWSVSHRFADWWRQLWNWRIPLTPSHHAELE